TNFDKIIKTKEDIKDIRNLILSLAIKGKLVEQREDDEKASELLKRIKAEKQRLIDEKVIKKEKPLPPIEDEEIPFDIPNSWEWVRLGEVSKIVRGGSPRPINLYLTDASDGINWIKIGDTEKDGKYINSAKEKIKKEGIKKSRFVKKGDFLLTNSMSFGRPYILNIDGCVHDGWLIISDYQKNYDIDFLYYMLSSEFTYLQFSKNVSGSVVKNLNIEKVITSIFPLPPIEEQKRIVSKVESLMKICDLLEEKITLNEKISENLFLSFIK
ncbi:restriction endonuclease subunit S, partial [uncultured Fusobacterium sp.]|uniref:restriction endonuclease subunit S n=1 Tax=uncultured Fusobacterium sp. TaxID=159267 RepID=UPI0027DDF7FC